MVPVAGLRHLSGPVPAPVLPLPAVGCVALGFAIAIWGFLRIPLPRHNGPRLGLTALDATTVALSGTLLVWHVTTLSSDSGLFGAVAACVTGLACVLVAGAITRTVLIGAGCLDPAALGMLGATAVLGVVAAIVGLVLGDAGKLAANVILTPLTALTVSLAVARQYRQTSRGATNSMPWTGRRRVSTVLSCVAVLVLDGLLMHVSYNAVAPVGRVVILGVVLIGAVVMVRQVLALHETSALLNRLGSQEVILRHQADHDSLTGLANRRQFHERAQAALADGDRVAVLLLDLDDFRSINDALGHAVGDETLVEVAKRLTAQTAGAPLVARLGSDEYGVLLRGRDVVDCQRVADSLLGALGQPLQIGGQPLLVRGSLGLARGGPDDAAYEVLRRADIAVSEAKRRGKAQMVEYRSGMEDDLLGDVAMRSEMQHARDRHEFFLTYQPVVDLRDGRMVGTEALLRWRHPVRGNVPPAQFIPVAERSGLIVPLGRWVLQEACRQQAAWQSAHGLVAPATVAVNVSVRQLHDPAFIDDVAAALSDAGLLPASLVLEITESSALRGRQVLQALHDLTELGLRLALDDFGTGESSLSLLHTAPVNIIKLDRSFVQRIAPATDVSDQVTEYNAIAVAVAQLAAAMKLDTIAEGIETVAQLRYLRQHGYLTGQGYLMSRPVPANEITDLLRLGQPLVPSNACADVAS